VDPLADADELTAEQVKALQEESHGYRQALVSVESDLRRIRAQNRSRGDTIKLLERHVEEAQARLGFVDALRDAPLPEPYEVVAGAPRPKPEATYITLASDWHMEENVRPETVGGHNEYNPDIAQARARQFFDSNLTLLKAARSAWYIPRIVLWLGGDLITGYIHEEYQEENWLSPTKASLLVHDTLIQGIDYLLAEADAEHILIPTSHGNHGRTTPKIRIATSAQNSHEWILYQHLARHYAKEPRVTFQIADGYHNIVNLYGFRIRFHHGDEIRYLGGIGGLAVPAQRRITRQAKGEFEKIHLDCIGHHHHLQFPPDLIGNGSLIGWNAYAEAKGFGYQDPLQASFVVDDRYKMVSNFNPVICTPR